MAYLKMHLYVNYVVEKHRMDGHTPVILTAPIKKEEELSKGSIHIKLFLRLKHILHLSYF